FNGLFLRFTSPSATLRKAFGLYKDKVSFRIMQLFEAFYSIYTVNNLSGGMLTRTAIFTTRFYGGAAKAFVNP
ncbi:MAG: hypothetical protein LUC23_05675, partial [Prevotellaceae bacterium]|nr:hypothetical protein [Prevotellaceae bacterium]